MTAPPFHPPMLRYPPIMTTPSVRDWQRHMRGRGWNLAADGAYGPVGRRICRNFQSEHHLIVDGIVGPVTWKASWEAGGTMPPPSPSRILQRGSSGEDVRAWQRQVDGRGWTLDAVDGIFGPESENACKAMQAFRDLPVTGRVDQQTWDATWRERTAVGV